MTVRNLLLIVLITCAAIAGLVHLQGGGPAAPREPGSPEQAILDASRNRPEDPELGLLFDQLNERHFTGSLPKAKVLWDESLGRLDAGEYRQHGMTDGKTILLNPALNTDDDEVRRTLCHEMVHVKLLASGQSSAAHDAPFQTELRRVFEDGCFTAILAPAEEKAALAAWIKTERERLDEARAQLEAQGEAVKLEAERVERLFAELNERIRTANAAGSGWPSPEEADAAERQRAASNRAVLAFNTAVAANERDRARFNDAVERYNLMMAYPDGLTDGRAKGSPDER